MNSPSSNDSEKSVEVVASGVEGGSVARDASKLSDPELNAAVAECLGWKCISPLGIYEDDHGNHFCTNGDPGIFIEHWRPTINLNQAFEAQAKVIEMVWWGEYATALLEVLEWTLAKVRSWDDQHQGEDGNIADGSWNFNFEAYRLIATATARQRCEAMLRAVRSAGSQSGRPGTRPSQSPEGTHNASPSTKTPATVEEGGGE